MDIADFTLSSAGSVLGIVEGVGPLVASLRNCDLTCLSSRLYLLKSSYLYVDVVVKLG